MKLVEISPYYGLHIPLLNSGGKRAIRGSQSFKKETSKISIIHIILVISIVLLSLIIICLYIAGDSYNHREINHERNSDNN